jgi:hypothetical protein
MSSAIDLYAETVQCCCRFLVPDSAVFNRPLRSPHHPRRYRLVTSIPWDRVVAASWGAGQREFLRLVQLLRTVTYMRSQVGFLG